MELLIESYTAEEAQIITESVNKGKDVFLSGIFMESEIRNRNNRIYRLNEIAKAVDTLNETIKNYGGVLSELEHPKDRLSVNMNYVCSIITEMKMNNTKAYGKMKILDTPCGIILKEVIKGGYRPGVSSRGSGDVNSEGIVEGFNIQTVDVVTIQSAPNSQPQTVYESLQNMNGGNKILSLAEAVKEDKSAQKYLEKEILKYFDELIKIKK